MSEVTAVETAARQLLLDSQSNEFLLAQDAGILNPEGEALFTDGTWRPRGYDSSAAPSVLLPPVATQNFRLDAPPHEEVQDETTPKRRRSATPEPIELALPNRSDDQAALVDDSSQSLMTAWT